MRTNKQIAKLPNPQYYSRHPYNNDTYQYNILFISKFKRIRPDIQQHNISITEDNKEELLLALQKVNGPTRTVEKLIKNLLNTNGVELKILIRDKSYYLVAKNTQLDKSIIIKILHTDKNNYVYSSIDKHSGEASKTISLQPIEDENLERFKRFDRERIIYVQGKKAVYKAIENEIGVVINEVGAQQQNKPNNNPDTRSSKPTTAILDSSVRNNLTQDKPKTQKGDVNEMEPINQSTDHLLNDEIAKDTNVGINSTSGEGVVNSAIAEDTTSVTIEEINGASDEGAVESAIAENTTSVTNGEINGTSSESTVSNAIAEDIPNDTTEKKTDTEKIKKPEKNLAFLDTLNQSALNNVLTQQDIQYISNKFSSYDFNALYEKYIPLIRNTLSNNQFAEHDLEVEGKKMFFSLLIDSKLYYLQACSRAKSQDMLDSYYDKYPEAFKIFINWSQSEDKLPITDLFKELRRNRSKNKESTKEHHTASISSNTAQSGSNLIDSVIPSNTEPTLDGDESSTSLFEDSQAELEDIIRRVQNCVTVANSLKQHMQDLQSEIEKSRGAIDNAQNGISESEKKIRSEQNNIERLSQQISKEMEKMSASKNALESTTKHYEAMNGSITKLKNILGDRDE